MDLETRYKELVSLGLQGSTEGIQIREALDKQKEDEILACQGYPDETLNVSIMYERTKKGELLTALKGLGYPIIDERRDSITVIGSPCQIMKQRATAGIMIISWSPLEGIMIISLEGDVI